MTPAISVIVPAVLGHRSVRTAIDAWRAQTCRDRLEIILLCPDAEQAATSLPDRTVIATGTRLLHEARAAGVRAAVSDTVMIAEDHCLPEPDCVERLLDRLAWGVGEGIGSLPGRRWVERYGWLAEVKPVRAEMVAARGHWVG